MFYLTLFKKTLIKKKSFELKIFKFFIIYSFLGFSFNFKLNLLSIYQILICNTHILFQICYF